MLRLYINLLAAFFLVFIFTNQAKSFCIPVHAFNPSECEDRCGQTQCWFDPAEDEILFKNDSSNCISVDPNNDPLVCGGTDEPICGNGILEGTEECDDGDPLDNTCSNTCKFVCGNGILQGTEECDDGNNTAGDGCNATCITETGVCGNGVKEFGEECDDGNTNNFDNCSNGCETRFCASVGQITNQLDVCPQLCGTLTCWFLDGNIQNVYSDNICSDGALCDGSGAPECGNGALEVAEQCDDGNSISGDGCSSTCKTESICGNEVVETNEECDDGNNDPDDGCDKCKVVPLPVCLPVSVIDGDCEDVCGVPLCYFMSNNFNDLFLDPQCSPAALCGENTANATIDPILECTLNKGNGNYTAFFGYDSTTNTVPVNVPVGANNSFTYQGVSGQNLGQPTTFNTGRTAFYPNAAFSVDFDGTDLVWRLQGLNGISQTATASSNPAQACPAICGNSVTEAGETCDDGNTSNNDGCSSTCQTESSCSNLVMYGIDDEHDDDSIFYRFDLGTGQVTIIDEKNNIDVEAMDAHPVDGTIYGLTGDKNDSSKKLIVIDKQNGFPSLSTGISLDIGSGKEYLAASFNPVTNEFWAAGEKLGTSSNNNALRTINLNTGISTVKAFLPNKAEVDSMAWDNQGQFLYYYQSGQIHKYNGSNGVFTTMCSIGDTQAMEFDPQNNLAISFQGNGQVFDVDLYDLNTCQILSTQTYNVPANSIDDTETITFACDDTPAANSAVVPVLECVKKISKNDYKAYFGYNNQNSSSVNIPIGNNNGFDYQNLNNLDLGQPTSFNSGQTNSYPSAEFSVEFEKNDSLVWSIKGPDNVSRTVTATKDSNDCGNICDDDDSKSNNDCNLLCDDDDSSSGNDCNDDDDSSSHGSHLAINRGSCTTAAQFMILDYKEVTLFNGDDVLTSSDSAIRLNNGGLGGVFDRDRWPYDANLSNSGFLNTQSRGADFRIYGFRAEAEGRKVDSASRPRRILRDNERC